MKRYVLLLAYEPEWWEGLSAADQQEAYAAHGRFDTFVAAHGRNVSSAPLAPATSATTICHTDDQLVVSDGPFAETREIIGGYYDLELPDLDTAIEAAALLPKGYSVEVRPVVDLGEP